MLKMLVHALIKSTVCHSDHSLLTNENQRPWFQDKYILVRKLHGQCEADHNHYVPWHINHIFIDLTCETGTRRQRRDRADWRQGQGSKVQDSEQT